MHLTYEITLKHDSGKITITQRGASLVDAIKRTLREELAPESAIVSVKVMRDTHSVSYWVEEERYWQFAGQGDLAWCKARQRFLIKSGHKTRMRPIS